RRHRADGSPLSLYPQADRREDRPADFYCRRRRRAFPFRGDGLGRWQAGDLGTLWLDNGGDRYRALHRAGPPRRSRAGGTCFHRQPAVSPRHRRTGGERRCPARSLGISRPMKDAPLLSLGRALRGHGYRFITPTPATIVRVNRRPENHSATDLAGIFGWNRPFLETLIDRALFAMLRESHLILPTEGGWRSAVRASTLGEALYFHSPFPTEDENAVF